MIIKDRIDIIRDLQDGWFDGEYGTSYTTSFLDKIESLLIYFVDNYKITRPYIYPNPEGLINVEWETDEYYINADMFTDTIELSYFSKTDKESTDQPFIFNLNDPKSVEEFYELVFNILSY